MSTRVHAALAAVSGMLLMAGCGGGAGAPQASAVAAPTNPAVARSQSAGAAEAKPVALTSAPPAFRGRKGELVNPDEATMVLLYYDLAELPLQIEQWLGDDPRVSMARAADKPAARDAVRSELEKAFADVRDVGAIRLSLAARLSEYDSNFGEFTVRSLAPSSVVTFKSFGQEVEVQFGNARAAQVWRVPQDQAQAIQDKLGFANDASVDALLAIRDVHAAPQGGTITVDVVEYELRENRGGTLLGRVQLAKLP